MDIYKENVLTIRFIEDGEFGNEPKLIRSVFSKFNELTQKAGFKKDFSPAETDLIRAISTTINKPEQT